MQVNPKEQNPKYVRMKADQAWHMAGLARQDGDQPDAKRWTEEARRLEAIYQELLSCR